MFDRPALNFKEVFKDALIRRMYPKTSLRIDDLAYAVGAHAGTVRSWTRGENAPSGPMVAECISFFTRMGDPVFLQELFPDAVAPLIQRSRKAEKAMAVVNSLQEILRDGGEAA